MGGVHPPVSIADDHYTIDDLLREILAAYASAGAAIDAELRDVVDEPRLSRRRARLKSLAAEIEGLRSDPDNRVTDWTDNDLRTIYGLGGDTAAADIGVTFAWSQIHTAPVAEIAKDTLTPMLAATQHMSEDVKRLVRASSQEAALNKLLLGQTAVEAGKGLASELVKNSIAAVVYRDGSRHGIKEYSDVVMRSITAVAYNRGTVEQGEESGAKYGIIHDGPECCLYSHFLGPRATISSSTWRPLGRTPSPDTYGHLMPGTEDRTRRAIDAASGNCAPVVPLARETGS